MRVLYLSGSTPSTDTAVTDELARTAPQLQITTVASASQALADIRNTGSFHALLTSPTAPQNETLALIATLRRDRAPIAIVPVVADTQQAFFASAVAAGADDVLVFNGENLAQAAETLTRIRQSPHLFPTDERRRLRVLYAGRDSLVWNLLEQVPFVKAERATVAADGVCLVRTPAAEDAALRCDVVIVDEHPGEAHPLQVVKSVKAQASDLPVVVLTSPSADDIGTAALDLGADDNVIKSGIYRRRLIATLRRIHQRLELATQHSALKAREARLRNIIESLPEGVAVIDGSGIVLAMNAEALSLFGASRPKDVVGREFSSLVAIERRDEVRRLLERICRGEPGELAFDVLGLDNNRRTIELRGVLLERDARDGRGVIAVLKEPPPAAVEWPAPGAGAQESASAAALEDAERRRLELEHALASERAEWEAARTAFQARIAAGDEVANARDRLEAALSTVRDELRQAADRHATERTEWETARRALEARLGESQQAAADRQAQVEAALAAARDEGRQTAERHAAERTEWETAQKALEARAAEAERRAEERSALEATAKSLRDELSRETAEHTAERARWETARRDLETRLQETARAAGDRTEVDAALAAARRELRQATDARADMEGLLAGTREQLRRSTEAHDADRAAWDAARQVLDGRLAAAERSAMAREEAERALVVLRHEVGEALAARSEVERALAEARDEVRRSAEIHAAERAAWDSERQELERLVRETADAGARRADLEAALTAARTELVQVVEAHLADRAAWEASRADFDARLREAEVQASGRAELEAALAAAHRELRHLEEAHAVERADWHTTRKVLKARLNETQAAADNLAEVEAALSAARTELRHAAETRAADQVAWEASQRQLEQQLRSTEYAQAEVEATLAAARAELRQAADIHAQERARWDAEREAVEARTVEIQAAADARAEAEAALAAARAELRQAADAHAAEREVWDAARRQLEQHRRADEDAHAVERARWDEARAALERRLQDAEAADAERRRLEEALGAARAELAALLESQALERSGRDRDRAELETLRAAVEEEHAHRTAVEEALRDADRRAEARLASIEAERAAARQLLEAELVQARERLTQLTAQSDDARAQLEVELARAAASHHRLIECGLFGHAVMMLDGRLVGCNDTFARMFGYENTRDAIAASAEGPFPATAGRDRLDARLTADRRIAHVESVLDRADGRPIHVVESATIVPDASGGPALVERVFIDMTPCSDLAETLRQSRRLEEVGKLASAVAPDVQRLVASIDAAVADLAGGLAPSDAARRHADAILTHSAGAAALLNQLLAFSRKQERPPQSIDLNEAVRQAEPILARLVGAHIDFTLRLGKADSITVSQDDLDQLFTTLVVSARDLLPVGGSLVVETARIENGEIDRGTDIPPGPHLLLAVTAHGYGVQPAVRTPALDQVARLCGGVLRVAGDAGRTATLQVYLDY